MIFQATWEAVLNGTKTETRRICKPGEWLAASLLGAPQAVYVGRLPHERLKWMVGRTYAVQPGRGKTNLYLNTLTLSGPTWESAHDTGDPAFGNTIEQAKIVWGNEWRKKLTCYPFEWQEKEIRLLEIRQERLQDIDEAGAVAEGCQADVHATALNYYRALWDTLHGSRDERWTANPLCWVLRFELAEGTK
jgi:hypothetical protein